MPVYSTANLILYSGNEDQFVKVSNDLWENIVPVNYTEGIYIMIIKLKGFPVFSKHSNRFYNCICICS